MRVCCLKNLAENRSQGRLVRLQDVFFSFLFVFVWFLGFCVNDLNLSCVCVFFYQRTFRVFGFCVTVSGWFVHLYFKIDYEKFSVLEEEDTMVQ